jgi:hypothetical protein
LGSTLWNCQLDRNAKMSLEMLDGCLHYLGTLLGSKGDMCPPRMSLYDWVLWSKKYKYFSGSKGVLSIVWKSAIDWPRGKVQPLEVFASANSSSCWLRPNSLLLLLLSPVLITATAEKSGGGWLAVLCLSRTGRLHKVWTNVDSKRKGVGIKSQEGVNDNRHKLGHNAMVIEQWTIGQVESRWVNEWRYDANG